MVFTFFPSLDVFERSKPDHLIRPSVLEKTLATLMPTFLKKVGRPVGGVLSLKIIGLLSPNPLLLFGKRGDDV
jgi:hypothetical protein